MNLIDVLTWIDTASQEDLKRVSEQLKFKQTLDAYSFKPGDPVKFQGRRGYGMQHGVFVKHLTKNVEVLVNGVRWRVAPQLIQKDDPAPVTAPKVNPPAPPSPPTPPVPPQPPALQSLSAMIKDNLNASGS